MFEEYIGMYLLFIKWNLFFIYIELFEEKAYYVYYKEKYFEMLILN